ncbi:hypothetical protein [Bradyrhizobium diazoefficiens]|uniref:hypothetical protein n=1 Tax=Bradyrhizobium diazoefficiens TaxID=1355477 RepID=UPI00351550A1
MAVNSVGGNGAAPATQQTQDAGFQNQMAEFERVSQKVQAQGRGNAQNYDRALF